MSVTGRALLKSFALKIMKVTNFDFRIKHHWVEDKRIILNSFKHKGYWFHGNTRERNTIQSFYKLIKPNQVVIEIGGHIGYLTVIFRHLVGAGGQVIVFEPSSQNLNYLMRNVAADGTVRVEAKAVSDRQGEADFYVEDLTGQNNSLIANYDVLKGNVDHAGIKVVTSVQRVEVTTLDAYCSSLGVAPDFIKIDIEGAEKHALLGAEDTIRKHRPIFMVEVTRDHEEIYAFMRRMGYELYDDHLVAAPGRRLMFNQFFIPTSRLSELGLSS